MEIFWTGLHSLFTGQKTLTGKTSLLMFPIYGCAAVIAPLSVKLSSFPFFYRGILYTAGFYLVEFISGSFLKQFGMCPWDYSGVPLQCHGVIRLDYAPLWFTAGLIFEKILMNLLEKSIPLVYDCARENFRNYSQYYEFSVPQVNKGGFT